MCSKEDAISYIENNNFKSFSEHISMKLINETDIFTFAIEERKLEYVLFMIEKVISKEVIASQSKVCGATEIKHLLSNRLRLINEKSEVGYTRLHIAVMDNEAALVDYILGSSVTSSRWIPSRSKLIESPLHLAIRLCHFGCVKSFIEHKVDVDVVNEYNETPLHFALLHNIPKDCYGMFSLSKRIDERKYNGFTILQMAVILNKHDALESILKGNANIVHYVQTEDASVMAERVSTLNNSRPYLPLTNKENSLTLSMKLFQDFPSMLLKNLDATSVDTADGDGNTLLHLAARLQDKSFCSVLLSKGASVNAVNNSGNNALQEIIGGLTTMPKAVRRPADVAILLIDHGIDTNRRGADGRTILYKSSIVNCAKLFEKVVQSSTTIDLTIPEFEAIVKRRWFRAANIIISSIPMVTKQGYVTTFVLDTYMNFASDLEVYALLRESPLSVTNKIISKVLNGAAFTSKIDIFESYLKIKVQSLCLLENGETILTNLILANKMTFVTLLLSSQLVVVCINGKNSLGNSPLHIAAKMENMTLCNLLITAGSNVNATNDAGENALQLAINGWKFIGQSIRNIVEVGILLIDSGTDTGKKSSNGRTVLYRSTKVNSERFFLKVLHSSVVVDLTVNEVEVITRMRWFSSVIDIISMVRDDRKEEYLTENVVDTFLELSSDMELERLLKECHVAMRRKLIDKVLNRAALQGSVTMFKKSLSFAEPNPEYLKNGETILTNLILTGQWNYAMILLKSTAVGIYVNLGNKSGDNPLHLASRIPHKSLCDLLIAKHADVNALNGHGNNAFHEMLSQATEAKSVSKILIDIGALLIDSGIDTDRIGSDGRSILHRLVDVNHEGFFIKVLGSMTDVDFTVQEFESIVRKKWFSAVNVILQAVEGDVRHSYITDSIIDLYYECAKEHALISVFEQTPHEILDEVLPRIEYKAAIENDHDVFADCLELGVHDPTLLDDGETLLTALMARGKGAFVSRILDSSVGDVYINTRNKMSEFPLHVAIRMKDVSSIEHFLVETVDICSEDRSGDSYLGLLFHHFQFENEIPFVKRIAKIIIGRGGNIYHKNGSHIKDIDHCRQENLKENLLEFSNKQQGKMSFNKECPICLCDPIDCSLNCGHVFCAICATKIQHCPVCRVPIESIRKLYL